MDTRPWWCVDASWIEHSESFKKIRTYLPFWTSILQPMFSRYTSTKFCPRRKLWKDLWIVCCRLIDRHASTRVSQIRIVPLLEDQYAAIGLTICLISALSLFWIPSHLSLYLWMRFSARTDIQVAQFGRDGRRKTEDERRCFIGVNASSELISNVMHLLN